MTTADNATSWIDAENALAALIAADAAADEAAEARNASDARAADEAVYEDARDADR